MKAIDLFAGAGGFTIGAQLAGCSVVWAANHWRRAVEIHALNNPGTLHACQDLHQADWSTVPRHDLLLASPACQGHSHARGKERAHHDDQRSTAWAVVSAAEYHRPYAITVENVPEFQRWQLFPHWCAALRGLGYALSFNVLDAADHGVPQHRTRLFVVGTRSKHVLQLRLRRWPHIPAARVIDFAAGTWSRIHKPGRSPLTLARIRAGRARFGDRFVAPYYGSGSGETGRSLDRPLGTITTRDRWSVIDGRRMRMLTKEENRDFMGFPARYQLPSAHKEAVLLVKVYAHRQHLAAPAPDRDPDQPLDQHRVRFILWGGYQEECFRDGMGGFFRTWLPLDIGIIRPADAHRISAIIDRRGSYSLWIRGPIIAETRLLGDGWPAEEIDSA